MALVLAASRPPSRNFLSLRRRVGEKASCRGFGSVLELGRGSQEKVLLHVLQFWLKRVRELNSVVVPRLVGLAGSIS